MYNFFEGAILTIVVIILMVGAALISAQMIADDCEKMGRFRIGEKAYFCLPAGDK